MPTNFGDVVFTRILLGKHDVKLEMYMLNNVGCFFSKRCFTFSSKQNHSFEDSLKLNFQGFRGEESRHRVH